MAEKEKTEYVRTLTGVAERRLTIVIRTFYKRGAISVQVWRGSPSKGTYTVRAIFQGKE